MSPRTFIVLALLTVAVTGAALVSLGRDRGFQEAAGTGEAVIPGLLDRVNDVARVVVTHNKGEITIENRDGGWTVKESDGYPARAIKVRRAILGLAQLRFREAKTRMADKLDKLELQDITVEDAKTRRVKLFDKAGTMMADLLVGRRRATLPGTTSGGVYVRRPGDVQAWLAAGATDITDDKREWLERKILDVASKRVHRAVIHHPGGETLTVAKEKPSSPRFTVENIPAGQKLISAVGPDTVGSALLGLLLEDVRKDWGPFDPATTITTDFTTFDGLKLTTLISKREGKYWLKVHAAVGTDAAVPDGKTSAEEAKEIIDHTRGWVFRISDYAAANIAKRPEHLLEDAKPKS